MGGFRSWGLGAQGLGWFRVRAELEFEIYLRSSVKRNWQPTGGFRAYGLGHYILQA